MGNIRLYLGAKLLIIYSRVIVCHGLIFTRLELFGNRSNTYIGVSFTLSYFVL